MDLGNNEKLLGDVQYIMNYDIAHHMQKVLKQITCKLPTDPIEFMIRYFETLEEIGAKST